MEGGPAIRIMYNHCVPQAYEYNQCVTRHPNDWQKSCNYEKYVFARCSETHPALRKVKSDCASVFAAYEACNKNYPDSERCSQNFKSFLTCVDEVASDSSKW